VKRSVAHLDRASELVVVEVGTWKGLSATKMAEVLKSEGFTNFNIICIDTWLGAPEFWTWGMKDSTRGDSLKRVNGYPTVFHTFTKNVKAMGYEDCIAPLPLSSTQAADVLRHYKIAAHLIYIDASHEYGPVTSDLGCFYPLLKEGCVMLGDDYSAQWKGVIKAVDEFADLRKIDLRIDDVVWSLKKPV
jgi:predicted O-methyltransferase YrrM